MAELLTIVTPNSSNRSAGDVVVVKEDGWGWSDLERKLFVVVRVPMTVEEAEEKYLKSGVPEEVQNTHRQATLLFRELASAPVKNELAIEAARELMNNTAYDAASYPQRKFNLDISLLPQEVVSVAEETKMALDDYSLAAKDAARAKVEAELIKIDGELLPENEELHTHQLMQVYEDNIGSSVKDDLIKASRDGSMEIIKPLLDSIETPPIVDKTVAELEAITIEKKV